MTGPQHPGIGQRVILIKNAGRKTARMVDHDLPAVHLHHQTAAVQDQGTIFLFIQYPGLLRPVVGHHLPHLHAVFSGHVIITAHHIGPGLLTLSDQAFIEIRCDPVIAVDKSDPLSLRRRHTDILGPALLLVYIRVNGAKLLWITLLVILQDLPGIVGRAVVHRNDLIIPYRLRHKGVQAVF